MGSSKIKNLLLILILFQIVGCKSSISNKDVVVKAGLYFTPSGNPVNGDIIYRFANGVVSGKYAVRNGIPDGEWCSCGYQNEIINCGSFKPVNFKGGNKNVLRIQEFNFSERTYHNSTYIVIIRGQIPLDTLNLINSLRAQNGLDNRPMEFASIELK